MGLEGFCLKVELEDGSEKSIPLDFDFSDVTKRELDEIATIPLPEGDYPADHIVGAGLIFLKARREIPEIDPEGFYPFILSMLAGDESVVEVV